MLILQAPVTRVTLLEDRAFLVRAGQAEVPAGLSRWRIASVSPALVDKTLTGLVEGPQGVKVTNLRVERYRPQPTPQPEESREEHEQRAARVRRLESNKGVLERELDGARRLHSQLLQEITVDAAWGQCDRAEREAQLEELRTWKARLVDSLFELESQLAAEALPQPNPVPRAKPVSSNDLRADVVVEIDSAQAGTVQFTVEYSVPGACWRPYHSAILDGDGSYEFRCDGCVWQNTGEDWDDVELLFSTQRPSLGADPPPLPRDVLHSQKKSQETVVQARDQEVQELAVDASEAQVRRAAAAEVPGIDDGGEALNLRGLTRGNIPSNGQPVRVEMFSFRGSTQVERVLFAEVCSSVVLKTVHKNESAFPILAGPVDLIREAGLVGRGSTLFVASGETFSLGWGPDPLLRAQRQMAKKPEEKDDLLGGWWRTDHSVTLHLSNLGLQPRQIRVTERMPLSEIKQVEVIADPKTTSQGVTPDSNGFLTWTLDLGPRGRQELQLGYAIRRRKEVVGLS